MAHWKRDAADLWTLKDDEGHLLMVWPVGVKWYWQVLRDEKAILVGMRDTLKGAKDSSELASADHTDLHTRVCIAQA